MNIYRFYKYIDKFAKMNNTQDININICDEEVGITPSPISIKYNTFDSRLRVHLNNLTSDFYGVSAIDIFINDITTNTILKFVFYDNDKALNYITIYTDGKKISMMMASDNYGKFVKEYRRGQLVADFKDFTLSKAIDLSFADRWHKVTTKIQKVTRKKGKK